MKKDRIDDMYRDLGEFSKEPPKVLWDNIEARLHPKKKNRRILILWGSAAAVLVMLIGYIFTKSLNSNSSLIKEITDIEKPIHDEVIHESSEKTTKIVDETAINNIIKDSIIEKPNVIKELLNNTLAKKQLTKKNEVLDKKARDKSNAYNKDKSNKKENTNYAESTFEDKKNEVINKVIATLKMNNKSIKASEKEKLIAHNDSISELKKMSRLDMSEELLAMSINKSDSTIIKTDASSKWSIEVLGGLTNTTASESTIQNISVNTSSQNHFAYALKLGYAISNKLIVKSGIGRNVLGQDIDNIKYASTDATLNLSNLQSITSNETIVFFASEEVVNDFSTSVETINEGALQQQLDYIQVPLEFSYKVLEGNKYEISLGAGGNINFLSNNKVFLNNEYIGENRDVNNTILGATLNSNISYNLAKKMILFLEPSYNYFDKPISNGNQNFNNIQIRVLFGLRYKL